MQRTVPVSRAGARNVELAKRICGYIRENSASRVTLRSLGERFGLSPFHLQRIFSDVMGMSPRRYLEECRLNDLRLRLSRGEPVVNALRRTGYSAQSWLYDGSKTRLGMTPATYRQGGAGTLIAYATGDSTLGRLLVAATDHGICAVKAGRNDAELVRALQAEFPKAAIAKSSKARGFLEALRDHLTGQEVRFPLDVRGTDFQMRVWTALRTIPLGETRSYCEVAEMVGEPRAVRAVANACASNPVPLIIPCHRVIRKDGSLGGYGLGTARKRALLSTERTLSATASS
jgi:AraC family transcriptional regulator, regulatory protein of adaptative response / methylated-DNA-[protein]-cysteine methyltransferase